MTPAHDHTKFIVSWLGVIALACIGCTTFLLMRGYQSGELMVGIASAAAGSLGTMVAMRPRQNAAPTVPDPSVVETTTTEIK